MLAAASDHHIPQALSDRIGLMIRSRHREATHSGEWGHVWGLQLVSGRMEYLIRWEDGDTDCWLVERQQWDIEWARPLAEPTS